MTIKKLSVATALAVGIATCSFSGAFASCPCSQNLSQNTPNKYREIITPENSKCPLSDNNLNSSCSGAATSTEDMKQVYSYPNAVYGENNYVGEQKNSIYSTYSAWSIDDNSNMLSSSSGVTVGEEGQMTGAAASTCGCSKLPVLNSNSISGVDVINNSNCSNQVSIETQHSLEAIKKSFNPFNTSGMTGAAAPLSNIFPDVPSGYWAADDINRLTVTNVLAGYPDRTFKPSNLISRAEFASAIVRGFNLDYSGLNRTSVFKDVPRNHWANPVIAKAIDDGIMSGYSHDKFKPNSSITRAEVLAAMAHGINCEMDSAKARAILNKYSDGENVPEWAQIPVAKALEVGVLNDMPNSNMINPNKKASRADVATMLQSVRIAGGYDSAPIAHNDLNKTAYVETEEIVKIPTLKLKFLDQISAKSSHVGQQFATTTLEDVTIDGKLYPAGSRVNGKILQVIRPSGKNKGALKLVFTTIQNKDGCKAELPRQILNAQIACHRNPNPVSRLITMPFTTLGSMAGIVGRTAGGMISNTGNAIESLTSGTGIAMGETFQGQFKAAGRSLQDAAKATLKAPVDFTRTALSGTMGLFQTTGDEVAYLVDPSGQKISAINPKEQVTIAFGCSSK